MKKLIAILLALVLVLSLCACKKTAPENDSTETSQSQTGSTDESTGSTDTSDTTDTTDGTGDAAPDNSGDTAPACTHEWKAATCTAPKTCTKCNATEGSAAGHSWKDATCTAPKTCSVCGTTEGNKGSHTFTADCTICGQPNEGYVELGQSAWSYNLKQNGELLMASYIFFDSVAEQGVNVDYTSYLQLDKYAAEMDLTVEEAREACKDFDGMLITYEGAEYVYNGWGMDNWSDRRYKEENGVVTVEFLSLNWDNNDNEIWNVEQTVVMKRTGMAEMTVTSSNYESTPVGTVLTGEYFGS